MTKKNAKAVSDLMVSIGERLSESLRQVRDTESEDTYDHYRNAVSIILTDMLVEVMNPLYAEHPDVKPSELK